MCSQPTDLHLWRGVTNHKRLGTMVLIRGHSPRWQQTCCKVSPLKYSSSPPPHCSLNFLLFALLTFYIFWHREENKLHFLDRFCSNQPTAWGAGGKASAPPATERENKIPLTLKGSWWKGLRREEKWGERGRRWTSLMRVISASRGGRCRRQDVMQWGDVRLFLTWWVSSLQRLVLWRRWDSHPTAIVDLNASHSCIRCWLSVYCVLWFAANEVSRHGTKKVLSWNTTTTNSWIRPTTATQSIWLNGGTIWAQTQLYAQINKLDHLDAQTASLSLLIKCCIMCLKQRGELNSRGAFLQLHAPSMSL